MLGVDVIGSGGGVAHEYTVSVCLASFNGAKFLCEQIDSVLAQLGPNDELIVSDDGSTDDTVRMLEAYGNRLRVVGITRAGGVVKNFERALSASRGDFVVLCDQDDVWLDGRICLIRERLRYVTLLMMNGDVVDADLTPIGKNIYEMVDFRSGFFRTLIVPKYVGACMAFRRELLDVVLPFPSNIAWHDWYIALIGELLFMKECNQQKTILFRRHSHNASPTGQRSTNSLMKKLIMRYWMILAVATASIRFLRRKGRPTP